MTTNSEPASTSGSSATRAYRKRIGFIADAPNFPGEWNTVIEKVKIADELGFDSIWLGESWGYELFTSISDLLRATKRIKVGAGIANIYSRSPALIASTAATLDERSGGRMLLGLGPSGANVVEHWHGVPYGKPVKRTREYVDIIRMILRREKLVYHGEFFSLDRGFTLRFKPLRENLPIYIAAMGPKNVEQAGEISDGILPVYWPGDKWGDLRAQLDEGSQKAGRPVHSAAIAPYITSVLLPENADDKMRQMAAAKAAEPLAYYIARMGVHYANMLRREGYGDDVQAVIAADTEQKSLRSAAAAVSPRMLDATAIIGTPGEVVAKLDRWGEAGVDEPLLSMPGGTPDETGAQLSALMAALNA